MQKNLFLFAFVIVFLNQTNAQKSTALGLYYSPAFTSRVTFSDDELEWLNSSINQIEKGGFGYSIGISAERKMSNKYSVSVRLGYQVISENVDSLMDVGIDKYNSHYRFIEMPIFITRYLGTNKYNTPYVSAGYSMQTYLCKRVTYSMVGTNSEETLIVRDEFNTINHALRLALGYDFLLDKKWKLKSEIFVSQFINSLTKDGIERRPISLGISIQVSRGK